MNLTPWKKQPSLANTTSPMSELQKEMNHLFGRFFGETSSFFEPFMAFPLVSVCENDKALTVTAEIPGIAADELDVRVDGNVLTIRGEKKDEKKDEKDNWYRVERSYGSFTRRIELPSAVDAAHAEASLDKGVLTLKLPRAASDKARAIKVQAK